MAGVVEVVVQRRSLWGPVARGARMPLATSATGIGKQVVTHAVRTWFGARRHGLSVTLS